MSECQANHAIELERFTEDSPSFACQNDEQLQAMPIGGAAANAAKNAK